MKLVAAKCPSCGANIKVDKDSDRTKCDYCHSQILVEDAIVKYKVEISGEVEIKNLPKLENYLKLGERYYKDQEYQEAYKIYCKAVELDPDHYQVVLRKGLCKSLCSDYMNFEVDSLVHGMKNAYNLLTQKDNPDKEKIHQCIAECMDVIHKLQSIITNAISKNVGTLNDTKKYISRLLKCLSTYEYLYSISEDDTLKLKLIDSILDTIDSILRRRKYRTGSYTQRGDSITRSFQLDRKERSILLEKKEQYLLKKEIFCPGSIEKAKKKSKKLNLRTKKILCYIMVFFSFIISLGSFITEMIASGFLWMIVTILFIPKLKEKILEKNASLEKIILMGRIVLSITALVVFGITSPKGFENTWVSSEGAAIQLRNGKATMKFLDKTLLEGNYSYSGDSSKYHITVSFPENDSKIGILQFQYIKRGNNITFCLLENDVCKTYYIPETPSSSYNYHSES